MEKINYIKQFERRLLSEQELKRLSPIEYEKWLEEIKDDHIKSEDPFLTELDDEMGKDNLEDR
jgi:hypothetical protein